MLLLSVDSNRPDLCLIRIIYASKTRLAKRSIAKQQDCCLACAIGHLRADAQTAAALDRLFGSEDLARRLTRLFSALTYAFADARMVSVSED